MQLYPPDWWASRPNEKASKQARHQLSHKNSIAVTTSQPPQAKTSKEILCQPKSYGCHHQPATPRACQAIVDDHARKLWKYPPQLSLHPKGPTAYPHSVSITEKCHRCTSRRNGSSQNPSGSIHAYAHTCHWCNPLVTPVITVHAWNDADAHINTQPHMFACFILVHPTSADTAQLSVT